MAMPTNERRFHLYQLMNENKKKQEHMEEMKNNSKSSSGSKTTRISGEMLKAKLKSGEIPNT